MHYVFESPHRDRRTRIGSGLVIIQILKIQRFKFEVKCEVNAENKSISCTDCVRFSRSGNHQTEPHYAHQPREQLR